MGDNMADEDGVFVSFEEWAEYVETNQASIHMRTSAANGFDGREVEVTVEGGEGETVADLEAIAERRFDQAVENAGYDETDPPEFQ